MKENFEKIKKILQDNNQEQLLNYNIENNEEIQKEILEINFEQLNELYKEALREEKAPTVKIEPIAYIEKDKINTDDKQKYDEIGANIIKDGKYAVVTMAGGQGTRLGHNGPKGTYDFGLDSHKSIFEVLCDNLKDAYKKYNVYVNWYIMTSRQNNEETVAFFEKNNYFGYPKEKIIFFKQGELPVLNEEGKLLIDSEKHINKAADGHGGIFVSMQRNGVIEDMKQKGIEWDQLIIFLLKW